MYFPPRVGNLNCDIIDCLNGKFDRTMRDAAAEINMVKTFNRNKSLKLWKNKAYKQACR